MGAFLRNGQLALQHYSTHLAKQTQQDLLAAETLDVAHLQSAHLPLDTLCCHL